MRKFNFIFKYILSVCLCLILANNLLFAKSQNKKQVQTSFSLDSHKWVAHALGGYKGETVLNCLECFLDSYKKGFRIFELDFLITTDQKIVAMHDGYESKFGLAETFSSEEFDKASKATSVTLLNMENLAHLMAKYKDWYLITDAKKNLKITLQILASELQKRKINWKERVITQVYQPEDINIIKELGYQKAIFTMYRFGNEPDSVLEIIKNEPTVFAVAMWDDWFNLEIANKFHTAGKKVFVHTVDDENQARALFANKVDGIYTNFLFSNEK